MYGNQKQHHTAFSDHQFRIGGDYHVCFDTDTTVEVGRRGDGPLVSTDVASLTRIWMGAASASNMALIGRLEAPGGVITALDRLFCLPQLYTGVLF